MRKQKSAIVMTISSLFLGIIGYFLRTKELATVFDPSTGLAETKPITIILAALSIFSAIVIFFFVYRLRKYAGTADYESTFRVKTPFAVILSILLAILMIYASYKYYVFARSFPKSLADSILALFAALSGIAYLTLSINTYRGKKGPEMPLCCFIIVIFICYWLILTYKQNAADPVILDYVYDTLALCSSALATYYITGFCYKRGSPAKTAFFSNLTVYLCLVAIAGSQILSFIIFYIFTASISLIHSVILILNLDRSKCGVPNTTINSSSFDIPENKDILSQSDVNYENSNEFPGGKDE